uniref:Uncharacterized protein n=1 Tax=Anguilla anguilla TaxID=7936 RepID=A0A0E9T1I7_ANGAN
MTLSICLSYPSVSVLLVYQAFNSSTQNSCTYTACAVCICMSWILPVTELSSE